MTPSVSPRRANGDGSHRLVYIVGASRSGSTILDALLGAHPQIFASGELYLLLVPDHGTPRVCSCGEPLPACPVWGPILAEWGARIAPGTLGQYRRVQDLLERFRHLRRLVAHARRPSPEFGRYSQWTRELLSAIETASGRTIHADSSKHPARALSLILAGGIDVSLIHLTRDPRGVVWSKQKFYRPFRGGAEGSAGVLTTTLDWILVTLTTEWLRRRHPQVPYLHLRYEDLATDPRAALRTIGGFLSLDFSGVADQAGGGEPIGFGHIMAGNRARHSGGRPIRVDLDWQVSAPGTLVKWVWALTGWLARRYGYRR